MRRAWPAGRSSRAKVNSSLSRSARAMRALHSGQSAAPVSAGGRAGSVFVNADVDYGAAWAFHTV